MSQPTRLDLHIHCGADYTGQWYWYDLSNTPFPVVNPAFMQIKTLSLTTSIAKYKTAGALAGWTAGPIEVSNTNGFVQLSLTKVQTQAINPGVYVYDMFVTYNVLDNDGDVEGTQLVKFISGYANFYDSVTDLP
jgi:hypothetical protein